VVPFWLRRKSTMGVGQPRKRVWAARRKRAPRMMRAPRAKPAPLVLVKLRVPPRSWGQ